MLFILHVSCDNVGNENSETKSDDISSITDKFSDIDLLTPSSIFETSSESVSSEAQASSQPVSLPSSNAVSSKASSTKNVSSNAVSSEKVSSETKTGPENSIVISKSDAHAAAGEYLSSIGRNPDSFSGIYKFGNVDEPRLINNRYYYVFAHFDNDPPFFAIDTETSAVYSLDVISGQVALLK